MNIGIVIKEVRKQKGLTQLNLSENANLSERTIQRIENNEVEPSFYSLKSIGEILGIDLQKIRNENSMMYTSKILGLHQNDLTMNPDEKANLELRLEKIESHLSSIARSRSIQLRNRKIAVICLLILASAFILIEVLAALGVLS
jgi:transcriptional regulator with XRE-family HTH domain